MFQLYLFDDKHYKEGDFSKEIGIRCRNWNKDTGFHLNYTPIE